MNFLSLALTFFCFAAISLQSHANEDEVFPARLLVEKKVENTHLVEGQEILVHYKVFNVGGKPATNVEIVETTLPRQHFQWLNGTNKVQIATVAPNSHEIRSLLFKPNEGVSGHLNFTFATVQYQSENVQQIGLTSEPGFTFILSAEEYERRFSLHLFDWLIFASLALVSTFAPFLAWYSSKSKYEGLLALKKDKKH